MHGKDLEIIKELMEKLAGEMSYSKDDFEERLGRKKPDVEILKVKAGKMPMDMDSEDGAMEEESLAGAMELGGIEDEEGEMDDDEYEDEEEMMPAGKKSLRDRLLALRG